jgi:hypothetical protein
MPKGVPRSEGEKIGDKFDKEYRKMKNKSDKDKSARRKECKDKKTKGKCACGE